MKVENFCEFLFVLLQTAVPSEKASTLEEKNAWDNVVPTSPRRHDFAATLERLCFLLK